MKKAIVLICAVSLLLLCGCNKEAPEAAAENTTETVTNTVAPTEETIKVHVPGTDSENIHVENPFESENFDDAELTPTAAEEEDTSSNKDEESVKPSEKEETTPTEETTADDAQEQPTVALSEYEAFQNMSGVEQKAYMESFDSVEAFFEWLNNARAEHEAGQSSVLVGDEPVELG